MGMTRAKYADAVHNSECNSTALLAHARRQHRSHETTLHANAGISSGAGSLFATSPDLSSRFMSSECVSAGKLAKDIASFALEGGTIFIGVDEDSSPPPLR
jgi:hypothetical protein